MNKITTQVTKPHRTSIECKLIHMSVIDSSLERWQTSKINDESWQTIPDKRAIRSVKKITSDIHATYI